MRRTIRLDHSAPTALMNFRALASALTWLPVHAPVPSAAPILRRCRRNESWGKVGAPLR